MKKLKEMCSIKWCFWPAKYRIKLYTVGWTKKIYLYECWFHGGLIPWLEPLWDFVIGNSIRRFYWYCERRCAGIKEFQWKHRFHISRTREIIEFINRRIR